MQIHGTETVSSVIEMITCFEKISIKKLDYKIVEKREGYITEAYSNSDKQVPFWLEHRFESGSSYGKGLKMGTKN